MAPAASLYRQPLSFDHFDAPIKNSRGLAKAARLTRNEFDQNSILPHRVFSRISPWCPFCRPTNPPAIQSGSSFSYRASRDDTFLRVVPRRVRRATVAAARDRRSHRCRSRWTRWRRPWSPPLSAALTPPCCPNGAYRRGRRPLLGCRPIRTAPRRPINRSISRRNPEILR